MQEEYKQEEGIKSQNIENTTSLAPKTSTLSIRVSLTNFVTMCKEFRDLFGHRNARSKV
jgi:hypothetical protein